MPRKNVNTVCKLDSPIITMNGVGKFKVIRSIFDIFIVFCSITRKIIEHSNNVSKMVH